MKSLVFKTKNKAAFLQAYHTLFDKEAPSSGFANKPEDKPKITIYTPHTEQEFNLLDEFEFGFKIKHL